MKPDELPLIGELVDEKVDELPLVDELPEKVDEKVDGSDGESS